MRPGNVVVISDHCLNPEILVSSGDQFLLVGRHPNLTHLLEILIRIPSAFPTRNPTF